MPTPRGPWSLSWSSLLCTSRGNGHREVERSPRGHSAVRTRLCPCNHDASRPPGPNSLAAALVGRLASRCSRRGDTWSAASAFWSSPGPARPPPALQALSLCRWPCRTARRSWPRTAASPGVCPVSPGAPGPAGSQVLSPRAGCGPAGPGRGGGSGTAASRVTRLSPSASRAPTLRQELAAWAPDGLAVGELLPRRPPSSPQPETDRGRLPPLGTAPRTQDGGA